MKGKTLTFLLLLLSSLVFAAPAEEQLLIFQKTFHKGNIQDKIRVINDASLQEEKMPEIFSSSMDFVLDNAKYLADDNSMIALAELTIENSNQVDEETAISFLLNVFSLYNSKDIKNAVLESITENKYNNNEINQLVENYGIFLMENDFSEEKSMFTLLSCLEKNKNSDFFNLLFRYATSNKVSDLIRNKAEQVISSLETDYKTNMINIIENGTISEKKLALKLILENEKNSDFLRAEVSEKALQVSIIYIGDTEQQDFIDFQLTALRELRRVAWTRSSDLIVEYFDIARSQYEAGLLKETEYIEIIAGVSELASIKASSILSDYLAYFNSQTEQGISCSEPVVLAVINALGNLGNKTAFDNLLYVGYLSYSEEIIEASRVALAGLKF